MVYLSEIKDDLTRLKVSFLYPYVVPVLSKQIEIDGKLQSVFDTAHSTTSFIEANEYNKRNSDILKEYIMSHEQAKKLDIEGVIELLEDNKFLQKKVVAIFTLIENDDIRKQTIEKLKAVLEKGETVKTLMKK